MIVNDSDVSAETRQNFRIYTTLIQIVEQRGYYVPDSRKVATAVQFDRTKGDLERQVFYLDGDEQQKNALGLHCNFNRDKVDENIVSRFLQLYKANFETIIFVTGAKDKKEKSETDKQIQHKIMEQTSVRTQIFRDEDLLFNVLKHELVPKHKILKDDQKEEILKYYKVKPSQLPKILVSDPVARFLGLKKGQVVKITRKSETAGVYTTYRIGI